MKILPDIARSSGIKFIFAKSLPYMLRIKIIAVCVILGIVVELFIHFWLGLLLVMVGTLLSIIKGYAAVPQFSGAEEWNQVTPDEYKKVRLKQEQLKQWDIDAFDITNPLGLGVFAVITVLCVIIYFMLEFYGAMRFAACWKWNALVIFLPHWFSGIRDFLRQDKLIIKIKFLEKIIDRLSSPSDIQVLPMLATKKAKEGGRVPNDARLLVRFLNAPDYFLGMQVQISINTVQGSDYPYLYCVLIAKKEANFFINKASFLKYPPGNVLFEKTKSADVDVLVIRQLTTKTSGYHTPPGVAAVLVEQTVALVRKMLSD
ncbi:MAG: hypothetical protein HY810_04980 [Candidatus Omnitrophica bacterium]|nr:hypothetical protein [Candidatus Omnitrophota bacterium]